MEGYKGFGLQNMWLFDQFGTNWQLSWCNFGHKVKLGHIRQTPKDILAGILQFVWKRIEKQKSVGVDFFSSNVGFNEPRGVIVPKMLFLAG